LNSPSRPGAVPADATKKSHEPTRELFKQCALAVAYGMEAEGLARRLGQPPTVARDLLRSHHETYRRFWAWSDAAVDRAMLTDSLRDTFGWQIHIGENPNPRSLRNFPMQANGAEMLRLATCFATEQGIEVCALIHDAVLICAPLDRLEADTASMQACMAKASRVVLAGFELRSDGKFVRYPHRYRDSRGARMWDRVMRLIAQREAIKHEVA
jgi:DNA polymerase I